MAGLGGAGPDTEGGAGGRQGGRGPAPGSAWVKFKATQVLGESAAGIFSSAPPEYVQKENHEQEKEAEEVEAQACVCGDLRWRREGVPPPDFAVVADEVGPSYRAELYVFVLKPPGQELKEIRVSGPRRQSVQEARKDGCELLREAFRTAQEDDGRLERVRLRAQELLLIDWRPDELVGSDVLESAERRLPEFTTATQAEKFKEQQQAVSSLREWIYAKKEEQVESYTPSGPSWAKAGQATSVPRLPGVWYVHERQRESGRPAPWLFFNASTGKYYRAPQGEAGKWAQAGAPHAPVAHAVSIAHGAVCLPAAAGRKDDLAVALAELARTGSLLKLPLPFLDKPAALFLLSDGLRGSAAASEFCAKRFHAQFLPRLSARPTEFEDHELFAIITEAIECLDAALLESSARNSGCGLALALILGKRLVVGTLGDCRAVLCRPEAQAKGASKEGQWHAQTLATGKGGRGPTGDVQEAERRRLLLAMAPLDLPEARCLHASSASSEVLAALPTEAERAVFRVARAAHPFAALGLQPGDLSGGAAVVQAALASFEDVVPSTDVATLTSLARARIREAAAEVEAMVSMDAYATQLLAELYYMMDEERGIPTPKRAAAILGVELGCGEAAAKAAIDRRYRAPISGIASRSPEHAARGFRILAEVAEVAARPVGPLIWAPAGDRSVGVTRALGFRDLKRPRQLVGTEVSMEALSLAPGVSTLVLLTDGARSLDEARIAEIARLHQDRPKAASLRAATDAAAASPEEAVGAITIHVHVDEEPAGEGASDAKAAAAAARQPEPKRRRIAEGPAPGAGQPGKVAKIRVAHVLLKFAGCGDSDSHARRPAPASRTQLDAERELLGLLESLQREDVKGRAGKFAALCRERSDCKSALNTPHADLGWVTPGQWGREFDAAAFDLQPGGVSDIVVSPRGAHLLYRLA